MKLEPPANLRFAVRLMGPAGQWSRDEAMRGARTGHYTWLGPYDPVPTLMVALLLDTGEQR